MQGGRDRASGVRQLAVFLSLRSKNVEDIPMYQKLIHVDSVAWEHSGFPGVHFKLLSGDPGIGPSVAIYRLDAGSSIPAHSHSLANETAYVLEGELIENGEAFGPGAVLTGLAGTEHGPHRSETGCTVLFALSGELDFIVANQFGGIE